MQNISKFITKADFMGIQLKPTLKGNNRIKSVFGGLISVIATVCILFGFVYFGMSMIKQDKPIMNVVQEMREETFIKVSENPFMMIVYDDTGRIIHNDPGFKRGLTIKPHLTRLRPDKEKAYAIDWFRGGVKKCDKTEIAPKVYDQLEQINHLTEESLCLDSGSLKNAKGEKLDEVYLKNRYGEYDSDFINFKFTHCDEQADPGCGDYFLSIKKVLVFVYKMNYYIDPTDYENPVKTDLIQQAYSISKSVSQAVYMPTRINEIVTDSSLFLSDEKRETFYTMMPPNITVVEYKESERVLLDLVVSGENLVNINQRRYLKIPELLANMGGFMKAALVIGNMLSYLYSEFVYFSVVTKLELKHKQAKSSILDSQSVLKSSSSPIKVAPKEVKANIPSFYEYLKLFLTNKNKLSRKNSFKYLELDYIIDCLIFLEQIKKERENNFVNQENK